MKHGKITAATIARTAVLALALTNQILSTTGHAVLPIESAQLEQLVTAALTIGASVVGWWNNNSFTQEAIEAVILPCFIGDTPFSDAAFQPTQRLWVGRTSM